VSFVHSTSVLPIGLVTNIAGSGIDQGTLPINGWLMSLRHSLLFLCIGNMVFFRSVFFMRSRMNREVQVRFCERFRGEIPLYLLDVCSALLMGTKTHIVL
jgi:hypothetical protein